MAEDGKIIYKVDIDDTGVESDAQAAGERAGNAVEKGAGKGATALEEALIGAARRVGEAFINMAAKGVEGIGKVAEIGIDFNAKMETYQTAFTTLLGSAEEADRVMTQIREDAAKTPFDVDSLTSANQALVAAGVDADAARDDVLNLANAIAATGGGSAELSRMATNLQGIRNTGKATAQDIRQFASAGINIYGLLADAMGVTTEEAANMEVSYEDLTKAFAMAAEEGGVYAGALEKQSETFTGRLSTIKDNATQLAGALTEDLFNKLTGLQGDVMGWLGTLLEAAQTGGIEGAIGAAKTILANILQSVLDGMPAMMDAGIGLLLNIAQGIVNALPHILQAGVQLLSALIQCIISHLPEIISTGIQLLVSLVTGLLKMIPYLIGELPKIISAIVDAFANTDWLAIGMAIVQGIWDGVMALWDSLVSNVTGLMDGLVGTVMGVFGIASPSKVFRWIFEQNVEGSKKGLEDEEDSLTQTVRRIYSTVPETAMDAMEMDSGYGSITGPDQISRSLSYTMTATGKLPDTSITVPLYLDGREVARATAWTMGEQLAWEEL